MSARIMSEMDLLSVCACRVHSEIIGCAIWAVFKGPAYLVCHTQRALWDCLLSRKSDFLCYDRGMYKIMKFRLKMMKFDSLPTSQSEQHVRFSDFLFRNFAYHISLWELYDLILITMTSHERHVVWNHRSFECLFNSLWGPTSKKHQNLLYWSFVRGIHRWPGDSPHKGPVTRKKLPFDDVIMLLYNVFFGQWNCSTSYGYHTIPTQAWPGYAQESSMFCMSHSALNSSPSGQNGRHFTDDIFLCIFMNEKFCLLVQISQKFVPNGPIDDNQALAQIMAWRRIGDKPLSEPMLTQFTDTYMRH